jgi:hypothetical protein
MVDHELMMVVTNETPSEGIEEPEITVTFPVYSAREWSQNLGTLKSMNFGWVDYDNGWGYDYKSVKPKKAKDLSQAKRWVQRWERLTRK